MSRIGWRARVGSVVLAASAQLAAGAYAATVPTGFVDSVFVTVPSDATAMKFSPDGRLFVCQQSGKLRVIQNATLLTTSFVTVPVDDSGERGLLGVAFDPDFATNRFVYVYYTAASPTVHNRVSRFTASGNVAVPGSEVPILDLPTLGIAKVHNGGAIHFGNDGKLYIAVGDNATGGNAQSLQTRLGKILRINRDGTIPLDNPFVGSATGVNRAIWQRGLRNPFTTAFERSTGRLFINDVGANSWEEINQGPPGTNFGWPLEEGPSTNPDFRSPFHAYSHGGGVCAITGGAFYEPQVAAFPVAYHGDYFYADFCAGWIRRIDPVTRTDQHFAGGLASPVDLKVGPDGALYYLTRSQTAVIGRISHAASEPPSITLQPADRTVSVGQPATFTVSATGTAPLAYRWRRNGLPVAGADASSHTVANPGLADSGALFTVVVSNAFGSEVSDTAQLTVVQSSVPAAAITKPVAGTTFAGGVTINYAGTGNDAEDGVLPASAFTWWVDLHHDSHSHPHVLSASGAKSGSFTIPTGGETSANVFYRIHLRVRDSSGLTRSVIRDVKPRKSTITLATNPAGLELRLDGRPVTAPHTFVGVEGIVRTLEAVTPQGANWVYSSWSDGGTRVHEIATPVADTTYTANYVGQSSASIRIGNVSLLEGNSGTRTAVFPVTLSSARTVPVTVSWRTTESSAKAGSDYVADNGTVTFPAGATSRTVGVAIDGDTAVEANEAFFVDLSAPAGATIADARGVGTIRNDDGAGTIAFSASGYQRVESGGGATITATRSGGLNGGMTVRYATANGTARAGSDYAAASGTLTFGAGVVSVSFQVPITNDTRDEGNETVNLALSNPAGGAALGTRRTAVLTILDNDSGGVLKFSAGSYEHGETGSMTIKVSRTGGTASGVTVNYTTSAATATATADYTPATGTLGFSAGQASGSFSVSIKSDVLNEAHETVNLILSKPTGGASLGSPATAVLTILDDD